MCACVCCLVRSSFVGRHLVCLCVSAGVTEGHCPLRAHGPHGPHLTPGTVPALTWRGGCPPARARDAGCSCHGASLEPGRLLLLRAPWAPPQAPRSALQLPARPARLARLRAPNTPGAGGLTTDVSFLAVLEAGREVRDPCGGSELLPQGPPHRSLLGACGGGGAREMGTEAQASLLIRTLIL